MMRRAFSNLGYICVGASLAIACVAASPAVHDGICDPQKTTPLGGFGLVLIVAFVFWVVPDFLSTEERP